MSEKEKEARGFTSEFIQRLVFHLIDSISVTRMKAGKGRGKGIYLLYPNYSTRWGNDYADEVEVSMSND